MKLTQFVHRASFLLFSAFIISSCNKEEDNELLKNQTHFIDIELSNGDSYHKEFKDDEDYSCFIYYYSFEDYSYSDSRATIFESNTGNNKITNNIYRLFA